MTITNDNYKSFVTEYVRYIISEGSVSFYPVRMLRVIRVHEAYCKGLISTDEAMKKLVEIEHEGESA